MADKTGSGQWKGFNQIRSKSKASKRKPQRYVSQKEAGTPF